MESTINFIAVVKQHEAIYDTTHQDYKNIERKARAWKSVAREVGITIEAAKRKWKNLRDSYTKYLRSFRVGTKTSRKYQYWAHADHMDFLRPFQGPGRAITKPGDYSFYGIKDESDLGFEMVEKCYPDEPMNTDTIEKQQPHYEPNSVAATLVSTFDRKTASVLRDVDSTSMFFLSLAKTVRELPRQKQATVKMLCMKIVNEAELEMENSLSEGESSSIRSVKIHKDLAGSNQNEASSTTTTNTTSTTAKQEAQPDNSYESFLYVMSPSRVEAMIDISSDEEPAKP